MQRHASVRSLLMTAILLLYPSFDSPACPADPSAEHRGDTGHSLAIVVNLSNPLQELSSAELRKIFLGERSRWPSGRRIAIAMMNHGTERETALRLIYRMGEEEYREHFIRRMFAEEVFVSPKTLDSPAVMRKFIFNAPGGIGYLRATDVDGSVKLIRIDGHLPDDKDYRLQIDARPER